MAKSEGVNKESTATTSELAGIMGLTPRRLQQLVSEGVLEQVEEGRFLLGESVQRYITHIKGNGRSEEEKKLDLEKKRAEVELKKARAKVAKVEAAELEGSMFRVEDVQSYTEDMITTVKAQIMSLPGRLAVEVATESNPAKCAEIIKTEGRALLRELSEYEFNPEFYRERIQERRQMELEFMREPDEG